ncbi:MAG TPA: lytic transglycosylase domain-containing protein [Streptosporangiaceae bacterium]
MTYRRSGVAGVAAFGLALAVGSPVAASAATSPGVIQAQLTVATLIPPAAGGSAPAAPTKPVKITAHTTQLHETFLPGLFAVDLSGISAAQLTRIGKLRHVRGAIGLDGGAVRINGRLVNTIGVNPARFRSWTPPQTADLAGIWAALDRGEFVTTPAKAKTLGLRVGKSYKVSGAQQPSVVFGGTATLGLFGVDAVVGTSLSRQLGLVRQFGALVSAPRANMTSLDAAVRGVLGKRARLVSLTQTQDAQQQRLPVGGQVTAGRPGNYLDLFRDSARMFCPGMSWTVLAAIGQIESGDGQNDGPSSAGALGPMQFMPSTWATWGMDAFGATGAPDVMNPYDAVPSAAVYLCAAGAGSPATLPSAVFAYNHAQWYVNEVLALAQEYGQTYG